MPSASRPKPSFPTGPTPLKPWIEWIDRQFQDALGATYATLSELIEAIVEEAATTGAHASSHRHGGSDPIDGDRLDVDYVPAEYTRNPGENGTVDNDELTSHLTGIDDAFGSFDSRVSSLETDVGVLQADAASAMTTPNSGRFRNLGGGAGVTYYWQPYGFFDLNAPPTTIWEAQFLWPRDGTIKNLRFVNTNPIADTDQFTLTLNINGVDKTLTLSGLSPNTSVMQSDTTHSVAVSKGDLVCFVQVNGGAGLNPGSGPAWCFDFVEA